MDIQKLEMNKRAQTGGLVSGIVFGVVALIIGIIVAFIIVSTLDDASLLTAGSSEEGAVKNLSSNLTDGVNKVAVKIPTAFAIAAIVFLLAILAVLVGVWQRMRLGGGSI